MLAGVDPDLESISSDDEIYLHQLVELVVNDCQGEFQRSTTIELQVEESVHHAKLDEHYDQANVDCHIVEVDEVKNPPEQQQQQQQLQPEKQHRRSTASKKKRSKKRNDLRRLSRYRYPISRPHY